MSNDDPFDPDNDTDEIVSPSEQQTVNAATKRGLQAQKDRIEREQDEGDAFWRELLHTAIGRRELWGIISAAHVFQTTFATSPAGLPVEYATWYAKGEQDFALRLYHNWLRIDPLSVSQMHLECDGRFKAPPQKRKPKQGA